MHYSVLNDILNTKVNCIVANFCNSLVYDNQIEIPHLIRQLAVLGSKKLQVTKLL
jgi:hypothetical protein